MAIAPVRFFNLLRNDQIYKILIFLFWISFYNFRMKAYKFSEVPKWIFIALVQTWFFLLSSFFCNFEIKYRSILYQAYYGRIHTRDNWWQLPYVHKTVRDLISLIKFNGFPLFWCSLDLGVHIICATRPYVVVCFENKHTKERHNIIHQLLARNIKKRTFDEIDFSFIQCIFRQTKK